MLVNIQMASLSTCSVLRLMTQTWFFLGTNTSIKQGVSFGHVLPRVTVLKFLEVVDHLLTVGGEAVGAQLGGVFRKDHSLMICLKNAVAQLQ